MASSRLVSRLSSRLPPLASRLNPSQPLSSYSSPLPNPCSPNPQLSRSSTEFSGVGSIRPYHSVIASAKAVAKAFAPEDGFKEILADYVHNEMTQTWVLIGSRLFLIIAAKDVAVSLMF